MCGIFAVFDINGNLSQKDLYHAQSSLKLLEHRGPDDKGFFFNNNIFLGHHRLSIIDTSKNGHQPMQSSNGRFTLIFNGQIYNWKEIKMELEKDGYVFKSNCDTESILIGFMKYRLKIFEKLIGMWTVLIWDEKEKKLIVSRDRLGIKPLYIFKIGTKIIFSSEIKSIVHFLPNKVDVNDFVLRRYIYRGWLDDIPETLYKNIYNFPQSSYAVYSCITKEQKLEKFWKYPTPRNITKDVSSWRELFIKIVEQHIQSDAPLATTLSGGLDSNAINSVLAKELGKAKDINAFSLIADDVPDESSLIEQSKKELGINHEYINIGKADYVNEIDDLINYHDEPTYSVGQINQFIFRKKIKERGFKVLLVGDGADEILAGYGKILPIFIASLKDNGNVKECLNAINGAKELTNLSSDELKKRISLFESKKIGSRLVQEYPYGHHLFNNQEKITDKNLKFTKFHKNIKNLKKGNFFFTELMDRMSVDIPNSLRNEDRNGMASSIEVRPLFLDHRLYEHSWKYPFEMMMKDGLNKNILRKSLENIVPKPILKNKKKFVRPGSVNHLIYHTLKNKIKEITKSKSKQHLWSNNIDSLFEQSCNSKDVNHALVWMRFYMIERTLELKF